MNKIKWIFIETYKSYDYYYYLDGNSKVYNCCKSGEKMPETTQGGYYNLVALKVLKD